MVVEGPWVEGAKHRGWWLTPRGLPTAKVLEAMYHLDLLYRARP